MVIYRAILGGIVIVFSFFAVYGSLGENSSLTFFSFLMIVITSLVLYQSFDRLVSQMAIGIIGFFVGRLLFVGVVIYANYLIFNFLKSRVIQQGSVRTYGIATGISSRYYRGNWHYSRNFTYVANGKSFVGRINFNHELSSGDTIYLRYSRSNPYLFEFEDNDHNRRHGIVR
ncbi:hypothetical protein ASG33_03695 [Dyadobacter sp. Leaf189]|nr:hypothetical protein ASG33_03695 [Dyadobacter sp. Leaf189]